MASWELRIDRLTEQKRSNGKARTVGTYQVFHDGKPAAGTIKVDGVGVPLSGTTAESKGPSQNAKPATAANPSRILAKTYPLATSGGPEYKTNGYRKDLMIQAAMPGLELMDTGKRTAILIHPGKDVLLSSIGCINLCTKLPDADEIINYPGSRRRVIALIEDMKQFLGGIPAAGDKPIQGAAVAIAETALKAEEALTAMTPHPDDAIDGRKVAADNGVAVKSASVQISKLHPKMGPVIIAVAKAAKQLALPTPVITSGNDGKHKAGSLHGKNRALDFRGNNITDAKGAALQTAVAKSLGNDYDVIFEVFPANPPNDHLHVEYDPD